MEEKNMHSHEHEEEGMALWQIIMSAVMLVTGMIASAKGVNMFENKVFSLVWYVIAFMPVGLPVMKEAWEAIVDDTDFFSEFMLMSVATIGAFALGKYPEAVAVMLLYSIGEALQDKAVDKARDNIKSLVAFRPDMARIVHGQEYKEVKPEEVNIDDIIEVRPGERVPLDGRLVTAAASMNTAALTGESVPRLIETGKEVMAGMISTDSVIRIAVTRISAESAISRILLMVEEAANRKSPTEAFIHKFAHVYTPVVILLAVLVVVLPWLLSFATTYDYVFSEWFKRALVFLVISCPCALVISIPLGYFGGIGAASKRGILFKGSNYLDAIANLDAVVFDKTGTLTTGEFKVQQVVGISDEDMALIAAVESFSSHPIASAITKYAGKDNVTVDDSLLKNIPGAGVEYGDMLIGTLKMLRDNGVEYDKSLDSIPETIVAVAKEGQFKGYILLADTLKADTVNLPQSLRRQGIGTMQILSGDKQALIDKLVSVLNRGGETHVTGFGDLLPQDKVSHISALKEQGKKVAFVGDGINDAPVLALSDVGVAMGAMGSDMAVETADVVIQTDEPGKVAEAVAIGKRTRRIVYQNIVFAIGVKLLVMILGVFGIANLWEAVFADSGVALLAVMNSTRIFLTKKSGI
jgi:Cd2+/Zn2+-exporting ATPase